LFVFAIALCTVWYPAPIVDSIDCPVPKTRAMSGSVRFWTDRRWSQLEPNSMSIDADARSLIAFISFLLGSRRMG